MANDQASPDSWPLPQAVPATASAASATASPTAGAMFLRERF
ncbi:hypothetical protein [Nonomuraea polychroma]|nr:hypothetical protein [Nonomuraea polychroma]